jgi:phage host-nuclease inhibitor protein Gam
VRDKMSEEIKLYNKLQEKYKILEEKNKDLINLNEEYASKIKTLKKEIIQYKKLLKKINKDTDIMDEIIDLF